MINIIIAIITAGLLLFYNIKLKHSWLTPSSIIFSLFFFSVLLAYPYIIIYNENSVLNEEFIESTLAFCLLLLVFLTPFLFFREDLINYIILPSKNILDIFSICVCILSLFALIYFIHPSFLALSNPDIGAARIAMVSNGEILVSPTIFNTIAGTAASFYQIPILLFFIYEILNKHKYLKWLLFTSSFSYVLFVLSAYGRDGIIFWLLSFLGLMGFFNSYLNKIFKRKIRAFLFIFTIAGSFFFMVISLSRFGDEAFESLISYIGQCFPNFCIAYKSNLPTSNGVSFPLFRSMLGLNEVVDTSMQSYLLESKGSYSWVFGTFLKSFLLNIGFYGTLYLGLISSFFFKLIFNKKSFSIAHLFLYILYFQIYYQGVFYFRQCNRVGNLLIIVSILLYLIFIFIIRFNKSNLIIHK